MLDTERAILTNGIELHLHRGEYLFRREQAADFVFFLKNGTLELTDHEQPPRLIQRKACFLGLEEVLLNHPHRFSARIVGCSETVLAFEKKELERLLQRDAKTHRYFLLKLCDHLAQQRGGFE